MRFIGLLMAVGGWALAVSGLLITASNAGRLVFAVAGIAVTLTGILGVLNKHYLARAIWKQ